MIATDTILKPNELVRLVDCVETNTDIEASLTRQAGISFKAGERAGIRKVMKFLEDNWGSPDLTKPEVWKAFLKSEG